MAAAAAALVGGGVVLGYQLTGHRVEPVEVKPLSQLAKAEPRVPLAPDARAKLDAQLAAATDQLEALEWDRATQTLKGCRLDDGPHPMATELLVQMTQEQGNRAALLEAEAALKSGAVSKAQEALNRVRSTRLMARRFATLNARWAAQSQRLGMGTAGPPKPNAPGIPAPEEPVPAVDPVGALLAAARADLRAGQLPLAKGRLLECLKAAPTNADCHKLLGSVYGKLHDDVHAAAEYREYLKVAEPDDPQLPRVREILEQQRGKR